MKYLFRKRLCQKTKTSDIWFEITVEAPNIGKTHIVRSTGIRNDWSGDHLETSKFAPVTKMLFTEPAKAIGFAQRVADDHLLSYGFYECEG